MDRDVVLAARSRTLRARRISTWPMAVGGALIVAIAVLLGVELVSDGDGAGAFAWAALQGLPGVVLLVGASREFAAVRRLRELWNTTEVPAVAMRMSARGLRCSIDMTPDELFFPWSAVTGFQLRTWRGQRFLVLALAPGVTASTPGVSGLDHPDVERVLHRKVFGIKGIRFAVSTLRRPAEEIDQALTHFSEGRVRIHP
ncbi:hypothetical protein [Actinomadura alba]|uniref:PH domain-containing protein n=1 Tax=Actinomadura alba TaxID=406431 RepID=A0ABR7LN88_9ACTN|nr:hypothetical protein [Actinomadura alba]MBC6466310.1 hypothetical protein [Actinomadura alba]